MKEYIERGKVLALIECSLPDTDDLALAINGALGITAVNVRKIPAADVVERKRGEWVMKETIIRSPYAKNAYCSECLEETSFHHNFCPNCGADMREVVHGKE